MVTGADEAGEATGFVVGEPDRSARGRPSPRGRSGGSGLGDRHVSEGVTSPSPAGAIGARRGITPGGDQAGTPEKGTDRDSTHRARSAENPA